jgi:hypothetical protein
MSDKQEHTMGLWARYLTLWVALCMAAGILIGYMFPGMAGFIDSLSIQQVNMPIGILLFLMIYPDHDPDRLPAGGGSGKSHQTRIDDFDCQLGHQTLYHDVFRMVVHDKNMGAVHYPDHGC